MQWSENLKHVFWLFEFKAKEVKRNLAIVKRRARDISK